ncbi:PepSY domain-containing protein [Flaviramulus sp. BrNp1-15]|uniref:PepSY-associated TM helix domain-containing protein n=1 Tax=Flaviramulus sp. BrNp1-15 TaxID=2916754 RepID=UPI001EE99AF0|nr:PepSY-associated TM helix domain-containing protein [Flaviramulus sp. BrNp1-15]ULC59008.1 PepSY domain-containing protein [Flaviramulus sp. BrNp1-15]
MKNRTYNILFHTHTVSGIVISVVLYVIFFAGSFSFFRDEIVNWERNHTVEQTDDIVLNFDKTLDSLSNNYQLYGRDVELRKYYIEQRVGVSLSASKDSLATEKDKASDFFYVDTKDQSKHTYANSYTLGEFLYRLHFLAQVPYPVGYYLSGFIAFFFLFAIITGVLVHWKKIVSNFYLFRPWSKLKTIWTDAHTALGMIGLPFQFVYAVTGAFFMIKVLLVAPNVMVLYDGNQTKFYEDLGYIHPHFEFENKKLQNNFSIQKYSEKTKAMWDNFNVVEIHIFNYNDANMHVLVNGHLGYNSKFNGGGEAIYKVSTGELVSKKDPTQKTSYLEGVKNVLYRIHYGDYGGYALKFISFLLGLISCFVIISGVMIWLTARDKKNIPEKKRRFNEGVVRIYLAICLSMYPITAASFIAVKVFQPANQSFVYNFYFIGWLLLTVLFILKKDNYFTNKMCLVLGSVFGFLIPITNGLTTGNWIWKSFLNQETQLFFVDAFWIVLASLTLYVSFKLKKNEQKP